MFLKSAVILIVGVSLIGCHPKGVKPTTFTCPDSVSRPVEAFMVNLAVLTDAAGNPYLSVLQPQQCGNSSKANGCIKVSEDKQSTITFRLNHGRNTHCTGEGLSPWRLEGVQMSMVYKDTSSTVTPEVQCDFDTDVNGIVQDLHFFGPNMRIRDWNLHEYDVFYTVTAISCDGTNTRISTDPWIENKG